MSVERLAAFTKLLAKPDPADLKGRGHRLIRLGKRDRWTETWLPAARSWMTLRLVEATDPEDGWKPARPLSFSLFLTPIDAVLVRDTWRRNQLRSH
jgi:hypothetical protein